MLNKALETNACELPLVDEEIRCRLIELEEKINSEEFKVIHKILKNERVLLLKSLLLRKQSYELMLVSNKTIREARELKKTVMEFKQNNLF